MDALASMQHAEPESRTNLEAARAAGTALYREAYRLAVTGEWRQGPRAVGRRFMADQCADANPIKEVAVGFILIGIALIIALTILPVITSAVETAASDGNISATQATLLRLLPTLLIVGLLAGGVAFLFHGFKHVRDN